MTPTLTPILMPAFAPVDRRGSLGLIARAVGIELVGPLVLQLEDTEAVVVAVGELSEARAHTWMRYATCQEALPAVARASVRLQEDVKSTFCSKTLLMIMTSVGEDNRLPQAWKMPPGIGRGQP